MLRCPFPQGQMLEFHRPGTAQRQIDTCSRTARPPCFKLRHDTLEGNLHAFRVSGLGTNRSDCLRKGLGVGWVIQFERQVGKVGVFP